jgi:hypothetical protein
MIIEPRVYGRIARQDGCFYRSRPEKTNPAAATGLRRGVAGRGAQPARGASAVPA